MLVTVSKLKHMEYHRSHSSGITIKDIFHRKFFSILSNEINSALVTRILGNFLTKQRHTPLPVHPTILARTTKKEKQKGYWQSFSCYTQTQKVPSLNHSP